MDSADTSERRANRRAWAANDPPPNIVALAPAAEGVVTSVPSGSRRDQRCRGAAGHAAQVPALRRPTRNSRSSMSICRAIPRWRKDHSAGLRLQSGRTGRLGRAFRQSRLSTQQLLAFVTICICSTTTARRYGFQSTAQQQNQNSGADKDEAKNESAEQTPASPPPTGRSQCEIHPCRRLRQTAGAAPDRSLKKQPEDAVPMRRALRRHRIIRPMSPNPPPTTRPAQERSRGGTGNVSASHLTSFYSVSPATT